MATKAFRMVVRVGAWVLRLVVVLWSSVFLYACRGHGASEGSPDEAAVLSRPVGQ